MTKCDYTLYIYKLDKRYKAGERLFNTTVWPNMDENGMKRTVADLYPLYKATDGWRMEFHPTKITVKSLMTGQDVQIDRDTPWACNPASESYWSN